jgi:hypothetical protein
MPLSDAEELVILEEVSSKINFPPVHVATCDYLTENSGYNTTSFGSQDETHTEDVPPLVYSRSSSESSDEDSGIEPDYSFPNLMLEKTPTSTEVDESRESIPIAKSEDNILPITSGSGTHSTRNLKDVSEKDTCIFQIQPELLGLAHHDAVSETGSSEYTMLNDIEVSEPKKSCSDHTTSRAYEWKPDICTMFLSTHSLYQFSDALDMSEDCTVTRSAVIRAFHKIANVDRATRQKPPPIGSLADPLALDNSSILRNIVTVGNVSLSTFLGLIPFDEDVTSAENAVKAFKDAFSLGCVTKNCTTGKFGLLRRFLGRL